MDEEKEHQKEIREKLESEGLDPDLSACGSPAQAGEFDVKPPKLYVKDFYLST